MKHKWIVIELTQGFMTVISAEDYDRVKKHSWHVHQSKGTKKKTGQPYARSTINGKKVYLHRFIVNAQKHQHVDHKNFQTLDNRRENLRELPPKENIIRRRSTKTKISIPLFDNTPTVFTKTVFIPC